MHACRKDTKGASATFLYRYEMDYLPTDYTHIDQDGNGAADFVLSNNAGDAGTVSVSDGMLAITGTLAGSTYLVSSTSGSIWPGHFTLAGGYTIEIAAKVQNSVGTVGSLGVTAAPGTIASAGSTSNQSSVFSIGASAMYWGLPGTSLGVGDNADSCHIYRVVQMPTTTSTAAYAVYRDGVLLTESLAASLTSNSLNRLILGDFSGNQGGTTLVDYLRFTAGAYAPEIATMTTSGLTATVSGEETADLLLNGKATISTTLGNSAASGSSALDWTVSGDLNGNGTALTAGSSHRLVGDYTGTAYGVATPTGNVTGINNATGDAAANGSQTVTATVNVGIATAVGAGSYSGATVLKGALAAGDSLAGLASKTLTDNEAGVLGTEATIMGGLASTAGAASETWRTRTATDTMQGVVSDVVDLSTPTGDNAFLLAMSYNTGDLGSLSESGLSLGWLDSEGQWTNAVSGNNGVGGSSITGYVGSLADLIAASGVTEANIADYLGSWGVDPSTHAV